MLVVGTLQYRDWVCEVTSCSLIRETFELQPCLIKPKAAHRLSAAISNLDAIKVPEKMIVFLFGVCL